MLVLLFLLSFGEDKEIERLQIAILYTHSNMTLTNALLFLSPRELPESGIDPTSPASLVLQADSLPQSHLGSPTKYNDTELIHFSLVYERTQGYSI